MANPTYIITASRRRFNNILVTLLTLKFGAESDNDRKVVDAQEQLNNIGLEGGDLVLLNGPASLPVAITIGHAVAHLFKGVACFDPKMAGYVVSVEHGGTFRLGQVIPASDVKATEEG